MSLQKVMVIYSKQESALGVHIANHFSARLIEAGEGAEQLLTEGDCRAVVFDCVKAGKMDLLYCQKLLEEECMVDTPLIVVAEENLLEDKLKALEIGCDDYLDTSMAGDEACARINKSIFNQIANQQLKSRLELANQTAHSAMSDNSDLGANIQFLLGVHDCDNVDELGQLFFRTLGRYGLHCSLQMRSIMGVKNMEAHGMAKDLESQMLTQLAGEGRYIDFGCRTIINYDRVSLLVKNMPVDDKEKYGAIKDNTFSLLQGLNARILVLEDKQHLLDEKAALRKISEDVGSVMVTIKDSYQKVMCDIVTEVENVAELIQSKVPTLALTEENEYFLENATVNAIAETNRIFNEGLVVDEIFAKLEHAIETSLKTVDNAPSIEKTAMVNPSPQNKDEDSSVELF